MNNNWISVNDRFPNVYPFNGDDLYQISNEVLGWSKSEGYVFVFYQKDLYPLRKFNTGFVYSARNYEREYDFCKDIIAWQPLPKPYRED